MSTTSLRNRTVPVIGLRSWLRLTVYKLNLNPPIIAVNTPCETIEFIEHNTDKVGRSARTHFISGIIKLPDELLFVLATTGLHANEQTVKAVPWIQG